MAKPHRQLLLWCDVLNSEYTLAETGKDWRRSFCSFEEAFEDAESRITTDAFLTVFNERGKILIRTTLSPLSTLLANHARPLSVNTFAD
jgi:hypothetical protein